MYLHIANTMHWSFHSSKNSTVTKFSGSVCHTKHDFVLAYQSLPPLLPPPPQVGCMDWHQETSVALQLYFQSPSTPCSFPLVSSSLHIVLSDFKTKTISVVMHRMYNLNKCLLHHVHNYCLSYSLSSGRASCPDHDTSLKHTIAIFLEEIPS